MKILFAKGNSQYGALRDYADLLIQKMKEDKHEVVVVDRAVPGEWEKVTDIVDESFDIVFSLQAVAYKVKCKLDECGKKYDGITYVCVCGDHPIYVDYWLKKMKDHKKTVFIVSDDNQYNYLKKYYPYIQSRIMYEVMGNAMKPVVYKDRKYDVYFGGTYFDVEEGKKEIDQYPENERKNAYDMIDYVLKHEGAPLEEALEHIYQRDGIVVDKETFSCELAKYEAVDKYIRGYYRNYFLSAALESDYDLTVCGNGWEKSPFINNPKFKFLGSCETLEQAYINMSDAKIIINIMPWSYIGFHDRLVNTVLCKAVCLTNRNRVVDEVFEDGKDLIAVGLQDKDKIIQSINRILKDDDLGAQIAQNGWKVGNAFFSFEKMYNRIDTIIKGVME